MRNPRKVIDNIREQLAGKPVVSSKDLIALGLIKSEGTLSRWRRQGKGPPCIRLSKGKHLYPAEDFCEWLDSCLLTADNDTQEKKADSFVFNNHVQKQHFFHIQDKLPPRPTVDDLVRCGDFGSRADILTDIEQGMGLIFTCKRDEAAFYASKSYETPIDESEYMADPDEDVLEYPRSQDGDD